MCLNECALHKMTHKMNVLCECALWIVFTYELVCAGPWLEKAKQIFSIRHCQFGIFSVGQSVLLSSALPWGLGQQKKINTKRNKKMLFGVKCVKSRDLTRICAHVRVYTCRSWARASPSLPARSRSTSSRYLCSIECVLYRMCSL